MKRYILLTLTSMIVLLSGCGLPFNDYNAKKSDVEDYNDLVEGTLHSYAESKIFAESEKDNLLAYAMEDKDLTIIQEDTLVTVDPLTEEQISAFERGRILNDDYFTALGSNGVREVLTLKGTQHIMYVTVVWGIESIISIDRVVVKE